MKKMTMEDLRKRITYHQEGDFMVPDIGLPEEEEDEEPFTFSSILASVFAPAMPSAERPFFRWKFITAASVMLP